MLVNGVPKESVSLLDRGLQYGDGVFETVAALYGVVPHWERHLARLTAGCAQLGIAPPDAHTLTEEVMQLTHTRERCVVKILITRGVGGRGYRPPQPCNPTRIVYTAPWPEHPLHYYTQGVRIRVCSTPVRRSPSLAGIKHLNRLDQVLARNEWHDLDIVEGLMMDENGWVIEATAANVFGVRDGTLFTPSLSFAGVNGVVRNEVLTLATQGGYGCRVQDLSLTDIYSMDELFLTNSLIGLWPVRECVGAPRDYPVGAKTVGAYLRRALADTGMTWLADV
ncbi:MAG: aminodeoxychorismate lyase [Gammaproteobacteria bacterium]|nr:aminodeoxychorismate lyase [Gammaproteobacteria bacterium]